MILLWVSTVPFVSDAEARCDHPQTCPISLETPVGDPGACYFVSPEDPAGMITYVVQCEASILVDNAVAVPLLRQQPTTTTTGTGPATTTTSTTSASINTSSTSPSTSTQSTLSSTQPASTRGPASVRIGVIATLEITVTRRDTGKEVLDFGVYFQQYPSQIEWTGSNAVTGALAPGDYSSHTHSLSFKIKDSVADGASVEVPLTYWDDETRPFKHGAISFFANDEVLAWWLVLLVVIAVLVILALLLWWISHR